MSDHDHDHTHDHTHEDDGHAHEHEVSWPALRVEALEDLLVEAGVVDRAAVDATIHKFEHEVGPMIGAKLVAKAWLDSDFKRRLLDDADELLVSEGIRGPEIEHLEVKANTPDVHNVVVCTLCSCYPWAVLGLPPNWYKTPEYRSRVVREPRQVLSEMGLDLQDSVQVRVWDSSSETRFMVLPERPAGTEGFDLDELAALVGRDSMIGVARADRP